MTSPEDVPPSTSRPKYLGPPPPPYPGTAGPSLPGQSQGRRQRVALVLTVCGLSLAAGAATAVVADRVATSSRELPPDEAQALIDEVIHSSPPSAPVSATVPAQTSIVASPPPDPTTTTATEREVARFTGSGSRTTPAFIVDGAWELRWQAPSEISITVHSMPGDRSMGSSSTSTGTSGALLQSESGSYAVGVSATGDWTITVVQVGSSGDPGPSGEGDLG
jgi:hypothetical protein